MDNQVNQNQAAWNPVTLPFNYYISEMYMYVHVKLIRLVFVGMNQSHMWCFHYAIHFECHYHPRKQWDVKNLTVHSLNLSCCRLATTLITGWDHPVGNVRCICLLADSMDCALNAQLLGYTVYPIPIIHNMAIVIAALLIQTIDINQHYMDFIIDTSKCVCTQYYVWIEICK